jgi:hypothetical protein
VSLVVDAARQRRFTLIVLPSVVEELTGIELRLGCADEWDQTIVDFLVQCDRETADAIPPAERASRAVHFLGMIRHAADAQVAVEVAACRPDFFVHRNPRHWGPHVEPLLGGTRVRQPREFLAEIGALL